MDKIVRVNSDEYEIVRLLGHGKGGYSYLALSKGKEVVLKQIHHEPCEYYAFGNKIEAENNDYRRLKDAGIRIPLMLSLDEDSERSRSVGEGGKVIRSLIKFEIIIRYPVRSIKTTVRHVSRKFREV